MTDLGADNAFAKLIEDARRSATRSMSSAAP
jgi:hypothetical protein